ncbi:YchJ family metal-binding protein [Aliivibrio sp. S4TY2]|uniref:YchJ family metal-binding protein n=1 Tax=unclassified Aliivibrio TaxID=2645654 RepID=UPI0023792321|nr:MULTISPECIES: YchJ family metal-binding protein [unclassified Aliivibrio]MDD9155409.1 YchJ family metal-binding protein [Aliivibrio sp. S4TY2]MDD9161536.1 YchJ family metal-binding protein [Aliivibrio sp. S4TY1]MDD9165566.1 YchJ family metal-binding protein [Aliivibrio sp. S4MY2]MDD9169565.1 YchJ family metal-binding protein [Aliivibrio sp. S4MY4]MDD9186558.1 YchJ family metal-binding protein [Aliivibrio sp. S4MY3]
MTWKIKEQVLSMSKSNHCPCGTKKNYSVCCEPIHNNHALAITPELLMRSRYSAHVKKLTQYIIDTYHPTCNAEEFKEGIEDSIQLDWRKLKVTSAHLSAQVDNEGFVSFKATYSEDGQLHQLKEHSRFLKEDGKWYYIDGEVE